MINKRNGQCPNLFVLSIFAVSLSAVSARAQEVGDSPAAGADAVTPFTIRIDDSVLVDLRARLDRTRFPDQLDGVGWDYGTDLGYLKELVHYWRTEFNWREQERKLNAFPQFTMDVDGVDIHFIHVRSKHEDAMPLVLAHGWPDSVFGFQKVIGPLTDPEAHGGRAEDAFHVICPSMAGYGFSEKPSDRGWSVNRMGQTAAKLMAKLGYARYGAQGGDWGSGVVSWLGRNDAEHVAGIHLTLVGLGPPDDLDDPEAGIPEWELKRTKDRRQWWNGENAYGSIQGTKPQTLGYGLNDSPAGLAAWIVEKWRTWADTDGDVESRFTKDELLTNVMIYWTTESITSSTRIYYESRRDSGNRGKVSVPTSVAIFPGEIFFSPRKWVETAYNVQQWTEMPRGGHFAAMEEPELFVEDVRKFFRTVR
jgi:pimeloyl-ACP methyl ester carboxylesterase